MRTVMPKAMSTALGDPTRVPRLLADGSGRFEGEHHHRGMNMPPRRSIGTQSVKDSACPRLKKIVRG